MKKENLGDKMAKKAFFSADFQRQWAVHMAAFGPILGPAFPEDYPSRVHLMAALGRISRRDLRGGLEKLEQLRDKCETNADKAAWLFFTGLCYDLAGRQEQMLSYYREAGEYNHSFYMPYLKMAKVWQQSCLYDRAEENYRSAIGCFNGTGLSDEDKRILGAAYTGLATTLTMMHRYEEAQDALRISRQLWPDAAGRSAAEAVLYAALGREEQAEESLRILEGHAPQVYPQVRDLAHRILDGTEHLFCSVEMAKEDLAYFWEWFLENGEYLEAKLDREEFEGITELVDEQLNDLLPFAEQGLETDILLEEDGFCLLLPDYYAVALTEGYQQLLAAKPEGLDRWDFRIVRHT